jgi:hypothetical protein
MLPIASLPEAALALDSLARGWWGIERQSSRKAALYQAAAQRKIAVVLRKLPDGMNMVRQDANRHGFERSALLHRGVDAPQSLDMLNQQVARPIGERDGEEENSTFDASASVTGHRSGDRDAWARRAKSAPLPTLHQIAPAVGQNLWHRRLQPVIWPNSRSGSISAPLSGARMSLFATCGHGP